MMIQSDDDVWNIASDIYSIRTGAADVEAAFGLLAGMDDIAYKGVINSLEELAASIATDIPIGGDRRLATADKEGLRAVFGGLVVSRRDRQEDLSDWQETLRKRLVQRQSQCQVLLHLWEIKGDDADPMIKAAARNLSRLSDSEYNNLLKLDEAIIAAAKSTRRPGRHDAAPQETNPFRRKGLTP